MRIPRRRPIYPWGDNDKLYFGTGSDYAIYFDGTAFRIDRGTTKALYINDDETYLGDGAGDNITAGGGINNTLVGHDAGNDLTIGDNNTIVGFEAMDAPADVDNCVFVGYQAGQANTQDDITAVGYQALTDNTGVENTAVGYAALGDANTGQRNTAVGYEALAANTSGEYNTAVGRIALQANTLGLRNCGCGVATLRTLTSGDYNTAFGSFAGGDVAAGSDLCVYLGYSAGQANATNERLFIHNSSSAFPLIHGKFDDSEVRFGDGTDEFFFKFSRDANDAIIDTEQANTSIYLKPSGTGYVKFGTLVGTGDTVSNGHILIEDAGGTQRKVMITA